MEASGILRLATGSVPRPPRPRPRLWRPSQRANLVLFAVAVPAFAASLAHRHLLDRKFAETLSRGDSAPFEIKKIREDLADQQMEEQELKKELDTRLKYVRSRKAREFYIVLNTKQRKFAFKFGDKVVRDTCLDIGFPETIRSRSGSVWTFAPVTGAFSLEEKLEEPNWTVPEWLYAMIGREPVRPPLPTVPGGLGRYVLVFAGGYVIHSPPPPDSPLKSAKPGSFMVPEADLAAIWKRIEPGTRIYVF